MKLAFSIVTVVLFATAAPFAAEQTWTGQISDSACGAKHEEVAEGQGKMPDRECTAACIRGGSKYVLVSNGKVHTWSCASTDTPIVEPSSQWFGSGLGHKGSTSNRGA